MFSTTFRLPDSMRTALRMFLVALLAVALVVGGQAFAPNAPQAQAQTEVIPTSPPNYEFKNVKTDPSFEFTIDSDATIDSLQFNVGGSDWLQGYSLRINGKTITPQFDKTGSTRRAPLEIVHQGLNQTVKAGDKIILTPISLLGQQQAMYPSPFAVLLTAPLSQQIRLSPPSRRIRSRSPER